LRKASDYSTTRFEDTFSIQLLASFNVCIHLRKSIRRHILSSFPDKQMIGFGFDADKC